MNPSRGTTSLPRLPHLKFVEGRSKPIKPKRSSCHRNRRRHSSGGRIDCSAARNESSSQGQTLAGLAGRSHGRSFRRVDLAIRLLGDSVRLLFACRCCSRRSCKPTSAVVRISCGSWDSRSRTTATCNPIARFPRCWPVDRGSVACIHAPTLLTNQFIENQRTFFLPRQSAPRRQSGRQTDSHARATRCRPRRTTRTAPPHHGRRIWLQPRLSTRRNAATAGDSCCASYPLLADAPHDSQPGRVSTNHDRQGQNMLFEDGQVRFIKMSNPAEETARRSLPQSPRSGRRRPGFQRRRSRPA